MARPENPAIPSRYVVENTHDGLVLDFPRRPPEGGTVLFGMLGWLVVGALTLWALAYPWASFVESMRWWAVNREVLTFRWMVLGMPLWPVVFGGLWLWVRGPALLRVKVDRHAIHWRGRIGWNRLAWSELARVTVRPRHLALTTRQGRVRLLPALPGAVMRSLYQFVLHQWAEANHGRDDEIPEAIRDLVTRRRAQEAQNRAAT